MPRMTFAQALDRLAELAEQDKLTAFEMGDIANDQVKYVESNRPNGNGPKLEAMAEAAGITVSVLEDRRLVSHRIPVPARAGTITWSVYREIAQVSDITERARLCKLVAEPHPTTESGRWTVSTIRVHLGKKPMHHTASEPLNERLQYAPPEERVDAMRALLDDPVVVQEAGDLSTTLGGRFFGVTEEIKERRRKESEQATTTRRAATERDPVLKGLDSASAIMDVTRALSDCAKLVAENLPRITHLPPPGNDPMLYRHLLVEAHARAQGAVEQIADLIRTGKPGGGADEFLKSVLGGDKGA